MKRMIILLAAFLLLLPVRSQAQSGGYYNLHWATIDGGGLTWSTGGEFALGGTIGQPDAGIQHTGGDYTLQGGFWHEACSPVVVPATITCNGDHVELSWAANPAIKLYNIYSSTSPYQPPSDSNLHAVVTTTPWSDGPNTCGDTATNYYYVVRAVCVGAHADDIERAEFDFGLVPGN